MKLHIECIQEKLEQITKENDSMKEEQESAKKKIKDEMQVEIDKLKKTIETL